MDRMVAYSDTRIESYFCDTPRTPGEAGMTPKCQIVRRARREFTLHSAWCLVLLCYAACPLDKICQSQITIVGETITGTYQTFILAFMVSEFSDGGCGTSISADAGWLSEVE